ncbi:AAA family ATPase [Xylophilus rhododendri]|uniref:AAA family ATPase n=1 Tax=Xylophilus rhododendri TaxID=2697032 RepID=A0A857J4F0_9BURK|nr:AAA family ATPase [Xylophilus rhododendri]QHI97735.1 AAA family ATPase [Xylophilus rhododendri]
MNTPPFGLLAPVQKVHIENFRGVRDLSVELHEHVTVFFGINAAGKTTLLDALAIGLGAYVTRVPKAKGLTFQKHGDIRIPWKSHPQWNEKRGVERAYARVTVTCANRLEWDVHKLRWAADRAGGPFIGLKQLHEKFDPLLREALEAGQDDAGTASALPLVAAYGTERAVVALPLRKRDFKNDFHRLNALDESLKTSTRFKSVFEWFVVAEDEERRERERRKDFDYCHPPLEWVRGAVMRAGLRCQRPRIETRPNLRMMVDLTHPDGSLEEIDIASLSDGYRTHFALVVDIARRMVQLNPSDNLAAPDRGTNTEALILIDEIDLHLDPTWQARVVKGLRDAFPRAQWVLTTHSEQVIGSVPAASVRKLVAGDGEVLVEPVPFAEGATSERILIELMGAKERAGDATDGPNTMRLKTYTDLVRKGQGAAQAAQALREELETVLPGDERLHQADLEMQKRELLRKITGNAP